jgi:hypothetical protein
VATSPEPTISQTETAFTTLTDEPEPTPPIITTEPSSDDLVSILSYH